MFKNYNTFLSTASFKPARLVWARFLEGYQAAEKAKSGPGESGEKTKKGKETLRRQVEQDRYVNDKLKPYQKEVVDFIKSHRDRSGAIEERNKNFLLAVGGVEPAFIKRMQLVIFRRLNLTGDKRATIDGKLSTYTLSALAKYLNIDLPEVAYQESNDRTGETIELNPDVKKMLNTPKDQLFLEYQNALSNELDEFTDTIEINDEMTNLVGEPTELFYQKIEDIILRNHGKIDTSTVDGWRQAFKKAGLKNYEIEAMGLKAEAPSEPEVQSTTGATTPEVSVATPVELRPSVNLDSARAEAISKTAIDAFSDESYQIYEQVKAERISMEGHLVDLEEDPYNTFSIILAGLMPFKSSLEDYRRAYLEWDSVKDQTEGFEAQLLAKKEAFRKLSDSIKKYYDALESITKIDNKIDQKYRKSVLDLATKYYLPEDMSEENIKEIHKKASYFPFVEKFLLPSPVSKPPIKSKEEFIQLVKGNTKVEKEANMGKMQVELDINNGNDLIEAYNNRLYSINIYGFNAQAKNLAGDMRLQRNMAMEKIRNMPL